MKYNIDQILLLGKEQLVDINEFIKSSSYSTIDFRCYECKRLKSSSKYEFIRSILNSNIHKKFCSSSCSATYFNRFKIVTESHKNKTSNTLNNKFREVMDEGIRLGLREPITGKKFNTHTCKVCKNTFKSILWIKKLCSEKCKSEDLIKNGRKGGLTTSSLPHHIRTRSKNERLFFNLVKSKFSDSLPNQRIFGEYDADIIIPSLKLAIHWNGVWHYKQIFKTEKGKHQFEQVQLRDKMRFSKIEESDWINYIIKDMGTFNSKFVNLQFDLFNEYISKMVVQVGYDPTTSAL